MVAMEQRRVHLFKIQQNQLRLLQLQQQQQQQDSNGEGRGGSFPCPELRCQYPPFSNIAAL